MKIVMKDGIESVHHSGVHHQVSEIEIESTFGGKVTIKETSKHMIVEIDHVNAPLTKVFINGG